jgi:hypothetical protein
VGVKGFGGDWTEVALEILPSIDTIEDLEEEDSKDYRPLIRR